MCCTVEPSLKVISVRQLHRNKRYRSQHYSQSVMYRKLISVSFFFISHFGSLLPRAVNFIVLPCFRFTAFNIDPISYVYLQNNSTPNTQRSDACKLFDKCSDMLTISKRLLRRDIHGEDCLPSPKMGSNTHS